ncbi:MAG: hypothetical protein EOM64_06745, partial [Erysipelotrichia bacterium]|nr:hypothetical protein [Erysipelotrichia bacterium]
MKRALKWMLGIFAGLLIALCLCAIPTLCRGYEMYQQAVGECSLQDKVSEIRSRSDYLTIDQIPLEYQNTLLHSEDKRFYFHAGVAPIALMRAACNDIMAGSFVQGGSTIDQQLAKNLYFDFGKTLDRKAAELFVVHDLESNYTKKDILELYVNVAYYGNGNYGLQSAANYYYNTDPQNLNQQEIDSLVYTLKAPNFYNPKDHAESIPQHSLTTVSDSIHTAVSDPVMLIDVWNMTVSTLFQNHYQIMKLLGF